MKEFKGTKGKWKFDESDFSVTTKGDYKLPTEICYVMDNNPYDGFYDEDINNGKLIAAAPELLEALQGVMSVIKKSEHWWIDSPDRGGFDTNSIEEAINKALGEEK